MLTVLQFPLTIHRTPQHFAKYGHVNCCRVSQIVVFNTCHYNLHIMCLKLLLLVSSLSVAQDSPSFWRFMGLGVENLGLEMQNGVKDYVHWDLIKSKTLR